MERRHAATMFLWLAVALALGALLFPWAVKSVDEEQIHSVDGATARYRLTGIELQWHKSSSPDGPGASRLESYEMDLEDHNLPAGPMLRHAATIMGGGTGALLVAALIHGVRPGPRRSSVGAWAVVVGTSAYFAATTATLAAMGLHANGWHAREVGPFTPWVGAGLATLALVASYKAIMGFGLFNATASGPMPSLPSKPQER